MFSGEKIHVSTPSYLPCGAGVTAIMSAPFTFLDRGPLMSSHKNRPSPKRQMMYWVVLMSLFLSVDLAALGIADRWGWNAPAAQMLALCLLGTALGWVGLFVAGWPPTELAWAPDGRLCGGCLRKEQYLVQTSCAFLQLCADCHSKMLQWAKIEQQEIDEAGGSPWHF
jgi:hypothetical protein